MTAATQAALLDALKLAVEVLEKVEPYPGQEDIPSGVIEVCRAAIASVEAQPAAIDMVLHCPACGLQHIDAPDERTPNWKNEPHRSHLCHGCGHIWRPADVATNGVAAVKTAGKNDSPIPAAPHPTHQGTGDAA